jgi:hypothetical protein
MAKFRKKPVVIEAVKLDQNMQSFQEVYFFMEWYTHTSGKMGEEKWFDFRTQELKKKGITIPTLEGEHLASWGDWIIKGVEGEFYPCKPDIFVKTYDQVL